VIRVLRRISLGRGRCAVGYQSSQDTGAGSVIDRGAIAQRRCRGVTADIGKHSAGALHLSITGAKLVQLAGNSAAAAMVDVTLHVDAVLGTTGTAAAALRTLAATLASAFTAAAHTAARALGIRYAAIAIVGATARAAGALVVSIATQDTLVGGGAIAAVTGVVGRGAFHAGVRL